MVNSVWEGTIIDCYKVQGLICLFKTRFEVQWYLPMDVFVGDLHCCFIALFCDCRQTFCDVRWLSQSREYQRFGGGYKGLVQWPVFEETFWRVPILGEKRFFVMSIRLSECISAAPIGRISVKYDIGCFYEAVSRKSKFG